jgi:uncharacterized protein (DUF433 family)
MANAVIAIAPDIMNGTPCFRGTRVPFKNLIDYLEGGHSLGEFLRQFPTVTLEMAVQAIEEAKDSWTSACHSISGPGVTPIPRWRRFIPRTESALLGSSQALPHLRLQ